MTGRKKGGKQETIKPEEASTKAMDTSKEKKVRNVTIGDIQEINIPPIGLHVLPISPQNVAEKKGKNSDNGKSGVAANESEKTIIKGSENSSCGNQVEGSSKKNRRRRRGKSSLDTSGSEPLANAGHESQKTISSKRTLDKNADWKLGFDNKALAYRELIAQRISQIESNTDVSRSLKKPTAVKNISSNSEKAKREIIVCTKEEKKCFYSNDDRYVAADLGFEDGKINFSVRPVIVATDKATQTDPAPDPPSISKSTDGKSNIVMKSHPDTSVKTKPNESNAQFSVEEMKPDNTLTHTDTLQDKIDSLSNVSPLVVTSQNITSSRTAKNTELEPKLPSFLEFTHRKNSITLKSDSDGSIVNKPNKPTLLFQSAEIPHTTTFHNKNDSFSNLSSPVETLKNITSTKICKIIGPEPPGFSKSTDGKNGTRLKSDLYGSLVNKPTDLSSRFVDEEPEPEIFLDLTSTFQNKIDSLSIKSSSDVNLHNVTCPGAEPELRCISKTSDGKNGTALEYGSDGSVLTKPIASVLHFPNEEINTERFSEDTASFQNKIDIFSNMSSPKMTLQSMTKEFLRTLEDVSKELEEGFMKYLKYDK